MQYLFSVKAVFVIALVVLLTEKQAVAEPLSVPLPDRSPSRSMETAINAEANAAAFKLAAEDETVLQERAARPGFPSLRSGAGTSTTSSTRRRNSRDPRLPMSSQSRVGLPLILSAREAQSCRDSTVSDVEFVSCLLAGMLLEKQQRIFECTVASKDPADVGLCAGIAAMGGTVSSLPANAQACAEPADADCVDPLGAFARGTLGSSLELRAKDCLESSADGEQRMVQTTITELAACLGLEGWQADPDTMLALSCASAAEGDPLSFAGCVGGAFTMAEIQKCLDQPGDSGEAGRGCYAAGNIVEAYLREIGEYSESSSASR